MTIPNFLLSSFFFYSDDDVTNVSQIINDLVNVLTNPTPPSPIVPQNPLWTLVSSTGTAPNYTAATFKSPVDSAGRFLVLTVTVVSTTALAWTVIDQNGVTVCSRGISIDGTPADTINYYTGQYHCFIEALRSGTTPYYCAAMMIEPSPYALGSLNSYVLGTGTGNSSGTFDGQVTVFDQWFAIENGVSTNRERVRSVGQSISADVGLVDFQGNLQFFPMDILILPSSKLVWGGRTYQTYVTDISVGTGSIKPVALDDSTVGTFRTTVAPVNGNDMRMMLRIA